MTATGGPGCTQETNSGFNIRAGTNVADYQIINSYVDNGEDRISNINLGLQKREQPDLALVKDVDTVKVKINEKEHIYKYADRFENAIDAAGVDLETIYENPQIRYQSKYGSMSYTRGVTPSDVQYGEDNKDDIDEKYQLNVAVTYRIRIRNQTENLNMTLNELVDYYDVKYENIEVGTEMNENGTIADKIYLDPNANEGTIGDYQKIRIDTRIEVPAGEERDIFVRLEVERDQIVEILGDGTEKNKENIVKLDNIVEISSYTTRDENGELYAGIDKDSRPENAEIGNSVTYEDDTDKAPGFQLILQEEREISGTIFEDETTLNANGTRQGDGKFNDEVKEKIRSQEVKVELQIRKPNKSEFEPAEMLENGQWKSAIKEKIDENGNYSFTGIIPGDYQIIYTWGDQTYKVQDYKSTIVEPNAWEAKNQPENQEWYKDEFKKAHNEWDNATGQAIRVSSAIDDYETRKNIDKQNVLAINANKNTVENYTGDMITELNDTGVNSTEGLITKMKSTTPTFVVNVEYYKESKVDQKKEYEYSEENGGVIINDNGFITKKDGYKNHMKNIDFGIAKRAKQELTLYKEVKSAKIILANGSTLATIERDSEGNMISNSPYVAYMPKLEGMPGQVKFEVDNEILEGAKLELEYSLKIKNTSEIDYNSNDTNVNFYMYGIPPGSDDQIVTLNAEKVIDHLDNGLSSSSDNWDVVDKTKLKDELLADDVQQYIQKNVNTLLETEKFEKVLKPGDFSDEIGLKCTTLLANRSNDILFNNDAEIIQITKTGGATINTTPGNYIPSKVETEEVDDDHSESLTVLPPTGKNKNYVAYGLLAISSLGILASGIIVIKKYILK